MADPSDHQTRDTTTEIAETVSMSNTAVDQNDAAGSAAVLAPTQTDTVDTTMTTAAAAATEASKGKEVEKVPTELQQQPPVVPTKEEKDDSLSIEPSPSAAAAAAGETAVCNITLLLPTGARHPYKLDEKYLSKRNVTVPEKTETGRMDPFSISIYTLKELILREWRDEWDNKPASPSSIRLIHFGKLLEDKEQLKKYQFSRENPNVVHMSVRPAEMLEEDEASKGKTGSTREGRRNRREGTSESCCVIL